MGTKKLLNLEGLRGLAALIVVFYHFVIGFAPFLIGEVAIRRSPIDRIIGDTPLSILFAGEFSVVVFFVLSGFVLSLSFFRSKDISVLVSSASRRYLRLMIPSVVSIMMVLIVMFLGGHYVHRAATAITGTIYLRAFWNLPINVFAAIRQGLYGVFAMAGFDLADYNPVLWTMHYELIGSFLVFSFLAFFGKIQKRWIFYAIACMASIGTYFLAFFIGMAMCDLWVNKHELLIKIKSQWATILLILGIALGSIHFTTFPSLYRANGLPFLGAHQFLILEYTIGASCLMIAVLRLQWVTKFLETRPIQYLGRASFSLYLVHTIVIYSLSCYIFSYFYPRLGYVGSFVIMIIPSLAVIFAITHVFERFIDTPSIRWAKAAGNWLISAAQPKQDKKIVPVPAPEAAPLGAIIE